MGADYIDFMVTDTIASPPNAMEEGYTEKAIYMPHSYFLNDYAQTSRQVLD